MVEQRRFTQSEIARELGVQRQVLNKWRREEILKPGGRVRQKRRGESVRNYTERDLIAAIFAQGAIEDLGFRGDDLREAVALIQKGDRERLARAAIVTVRTRPHFMRHLLISDLDLGPGEFCALLDLDEGFDTCRDMVAHLQAQDRVIDNAPMLAIFDEIKKKVDERLQGRRGLDAWN